MEPLNIFGARLERIESLVDYFEGLLEAIMGASILGLVIVCDCLLQPQDAKIVQDFRLD